MLTPANGLLPPHGKRILVLCGNDASPIAAANEYATLLKGYDLLFIEEKVVTIPRILKFSRRRLKNRGLLSLLGVYLLYIRKFIQGEKRAPKRYCPALTTADISTDPAVEKHISRFNPDIILICFCGLLSQDFLRKRHQPIYNIHPGINPKYRGFGNIWAFYHKDFTTVGYTIHKVDEGTDTGERIAVVPMPVPAIPFDYIDTHAAKLAATHLALLLLGQAEAQVPQQFKNLPSACYGIPTLRQYFVARNNFLEYQKLFGNNT